MSRPTARCRNAGAPPTGSCWITVRCSTVPSSKSWPIPNGRRCADWKLLDYGSLFDRSIVEILAHPEREPLRQRDAVLASSECADCRFWTLCHGGCPLDAWADQKSFHHKTAWCQAKRGFIEKYFEPITGVRYEPAENSLPKPGC